MGQEMLTVPDMASKLKLQCEGVGFGFLPEPCARAAVARGQLVIREVEEHKPEETFWLAWRTGEDGAALRWWRERLRRPELLSQWWQAMAKG